MEECREENVPSPGKEKIHKKWCLLGPGEQPPSLSSALYNSLTASSSSADVALDTFDVEVKAEQKIED